MVQHYNIIDFIKGISTDHSKMDFGYIRFKEFKAVLLS